ncbi:MAG: CoA transferase subunit A [Oscillospiraceae bacterium]|nr:CoA transferase subunit A [Oscillospiraceae bacterium]
MSLNPKFITAEEAAALIEDGSSVMLSGFVGCGSALQVIDALSKTDVKGLRLIMNDSSKLNGPDGDEYYSWAKLIHNGQVDGYLGSHLGTNPEAQKMQAAGELNVDLVPQGSLAEMIRAGGYGLGCVVTPTGVDTLVEDSPFCLGRLEVEGKTYLMMKPVTADWAIVKGAKVDKLGNVWYKGTGRNFAPYMAAAAKHVIVEAVEVVEVGEILPEDVVTPGILVDYIVEVKK